KTDYLCNHPCGHPAHSPEPSLDGHRDQPPVGRAVTELTSVVRSPAVGPEAQGHPAGMEAGVHLAKLEVAGHRDRREPVGGRAVAELPVVIQSPTVRPVVGGHTTGA